MGLGPGVDGVDVVRAALASGGGTNVVPEGGEHFCGRHEHRSTTVCNYAFTCALLGNAAGDDTSLPM